MSDNELFQAMQLFNNGLKDYSFTQALTNANQQVQDVKASSLKDEEKRGQLQQISNDLVLKMTSLGKSPQEIAQVGQVFGPRKFSSIQELALEGATTGNQELIKQAKIADQALRAGEIEQAKQQQAFAGNLQEKKFAQAVTLKSMGGQKQSAADIDFATNVNSATKIAGDLKKLVAKKGNFELWDEKAASQLEQAKLDLAIAYAKIVDPASVAREGEVNTAQKYMIQTGLTVRNSRTIADINGYLNKIQLRAKERQKAKQQGRLDPFDKFLGGATDTQQATDSSDISNFLE